MKWLYAHNILNMCCILLYQSAPGIYLHRVEKYNFCNINERKYDAVFIINVVSDFMPESERNKIAVGTAGLLLGLVFLGAGLIYYKKNTTGERLNQIMSYYYDTLLTQNLCICFC